VIKKREVATSSTGGWKGGLGLRAYSHKKEKTSVRKKVKGRCESSTSGRFRERGGGLPSYCVENQSYEGKVGEICTEKGGGRDSCCLLISTQKKKGK